jgi:hypothetical protein
MPSDDGLRLDNRSSVQHRRKQAIQPDEEQSLRHRQLRPRGYALTQHTQLVSQQHNLGFQSRLRLEWRDQDVDEQDQERDYRALSLADLAAHASPDEVLGMDSPVAVSFAGTDDLQALMVSAGWAWVYTAFTDQYVDAERRAAARGVGVHAHHCQPPWEWRALKRGER